MDLDKLVRTHVPEHSLDDLPKPGALTAAERVPRVGFASLGLAMDFREWLWARSPED
jgi:hypothetical protein